MPFFPESRYLLRPRELEEFAVLEIANRLQQTNLAAASVSVVFQIPTDRILLLQALHITSTPGAGQACTLQDIDAGGVVTHREDYAVANDVTRNLNWTGDVVVPAGSTITLRSIYSAGVAVNIQIASLFGVLIAVGNFIRTPLT